MLAHHAAAAGDAPRILQYAPAAAAEAARPGRTGRPSRSTRSRCGTSAGDAAAARRCWRPWPGAVSHRPARRRHRRAYAGVGAARDLGDVVAVGPGTGRSPCFAWYAADRAAAERQNRAAIEILAAAGDPRELGYALANRAYLAARGATARRAAGGRRARRIADELGDAALRGTASVGVAVVRLIGRGPGRPRGAARRPGHRPATAARRAGDRTDEQPVHLDVEQGRLARPRSPDRALRVSEERDVPICSMWQRGVRARLRLLQGRWPEAEQDALAVLAAGDIPLGRLWAHLVLGLLAARREAPPDNPHLDELWRLATRLDLPGMSATAAAALAEQAWITRRPDPRLDDPLGGGLLAELAGPRRRAAAPVGAAAGRGGVQRRPPATAGRRAGAGAALRAGARPVGRRVDRRPAGRAAAARRAGRASRRRSGPYATARARRDRVPRGSSPATRANPAGLTDRQLDVLGLLVDGLSNAEIAARLVISPRTADHHVSAVLGKLDARSRGEAVAAARRLGLEQ